MLSSLKSPVFRVTGVQGLNPLGCHQKRSQSGVSQVVEHFWVKIVAKYRSAPTRLPLFPCAKAENGSPDTR